MDRMESVTYEDCEKKLVMIELLKPYTKVQKGKLSKFE